MPLVHRPSTVHVNWKLGDTKAGTLVGTDRFGNKYYENDTEELPCRYSVLSRLRVLTDPLRTVRTKWVDYKAWDYDAYVVQTMY